MRATHRISFRRQIDSVMAGVLCLAIAACASGDSTTEPAELSGLFEIAGDFGGAGSLDGTGTAARFKGMNSIASDAAGNLYVADTGNFTVRKVTPAGVLTTFAGSAGIAGTADGIGAAARFESPAGIALDANGDIYVADAAAKFNSPAGVAVDGNGNVYVAENGNHTIRKITPAGVVSTLAGSAGSTGSVDGIANAARFNSPSALAVGTDGNLYVTDQGNHTIRKVTQAGVVSTVAGVAGQQGVLPGSLPGSLDTPSGITALGVNTFALSTANGILKLVLP